tara:strand:+ start:753 stop:995 length:243 start_codon:yes stop_codon:yes gene_type:complete
MQEEKRYIEQNGVVQQGGQEAVDTEEDKILLDTVLEGGAVQGKEGGLRMDMFSHDDPDDLQCICDLPAHAQDIIISESDL